MYGRGFSKMIRAIFLDYMGTIVQEAGEDMMQAVMRIVSHSEVRDPREMVRIWWGIIKEMEEASYGDSFMTEEEIVYAALNVFKEQYGLQENHEELAACVKRFWVNAPIFEDVKEFFARCPYPIYVITNNNEKYVHEALEKNNLSAAGIICADEVKAYKPHRELFAHGLAKNGLKPEEVIHIGDSYQSDVVGATGAKIRPILLDRKGGIETEEGLLVAHSLTECIGILQVI